MTITITRTYDRYEDASSVVSQLKAMNIAADDISVIAHDEHRDGGPTSTSASMGATSGMGGHSASSTADDDAGTGAGAGAGVGALLGGGAGLLAGLGLMAIPGVGPLVAAGWLATTVAGAAAGSVAGAATGGLIGALTDSGLSQDEAHTYAEAVRRGSILVSVRASDSEASEVQAVMDRHGPSDLVTRRAHWEKEGWTGYDADARPYNRTEVIAEQDRYR